MSARQGAGASDLAKRVGRRRVRRANAAPAGAHRARGRFIRHMPLPLAMILGLAAALSIAWDVALPALQGPDESLHFAYVQYLAEKAELPSPSHGGTSTEESDALEWLNLRALEGNLSARPAWTPVDLARWHEIERSMPRGSRANGSAENSIARNPPLYYAAMALPYRVLVWLPLLKRLFLLRLFNALCYLATIVLTWLIAGEVFGRVRWKQTLAAGVVALEPELSFLSAVINADNLLIALTTAFLLTALRLVKYGPSMRRVLAASVLSAAAVLTHGRGLVTIPVLAVALLVSWIRYRPAIGETAAKGAAAAATVGAAFFTYFLLGRTGGSRGTLYGGEVSELNSGSSFSVRRFLSSIYQFYFPRLPSLQPRIGPEYGYRQVFIQTFYGTFGSLEVMFKQRVYDVLQVLSALGLVGLYTAVVVRRRQLLRSWPMVVVMLALVLTTLSLLHYVSYRALLDDNGSDPLIVGRYLLPMVSVFGLAVTFTLASLPRRLGPIAGAVILAMGILLSLGGIGITMARFYA